MYHFRSLRLTFCGATRRTFPSYNDCLHYPALHACVFRESCSKWDRLSFWNFIILISSRLKRYLNWFSGTDCESHGNYATIHYDISESFTLTFTCSTNLPTNYPRWEINGYKYGVTDLPPIVIANGSSIKFTLESSVDVRCFVKAFQNGSVVNVFSEYAVVKRAGNQG